jgi:hypothetical protein
VETIGQMARWRRRHELVWRVVERPDGRLEWRVIEVETEPREFLMAGTRAMVTQARMVAIGGDAMLRRVS